jgi:2-oxoglutarate dehydrogenase E1 component
MDLHHLQSLAHDINVAPDNFPLQRQVSKILEDRRKMAAGAMPLNWGFAETLAYASLLEAGYPVRLTGQDVGRGTFSHRHAVLHHQREEATYVPLSISPTTRRRSASTTPSCPRRRCWPSSTAMRPLHRRAW